MVPRTIPDEDVVHFQALLDARAGERIGMPVKLLTYSAPPTKDPQDAAVQRVMERLRDTELGVVTALAEDGMLGEGRMLVRDGPLEFQRQLRGSHFRNVIGVSKTFDTAQRVRKGAAKRDVGCVAAALGFRHRSCAYGSEYGGNMVAHWYVRIHDPDRVPNPLDGVVKISKLAIDVAERENGIPSEVVDTITQHLLRERNVTPYGSDRRWANHLYPIYLAESYLRARFMSDLAFNGVF